MQRPCTCPILICGPILSCLPSRPGRVPNVAFLIDFGICAGILEKLKGLVAVVERKLGDGITVPAYGNHAAFLKTPKETVKERSLHAGKSWHIARFPDRRPAHIIPPLAEILRKLLVVRCPCQPWPGAHAVVCRREGSHVRGSCARGQAAQGRHPRAYADGDTGPGQEGWRQWRGPRQSPSAIHVCTAPACKRQQCSHAAVPSSASASCRGRDVMSVQWRLSGSPRANLWPNLAHAVFHDVLL